MPLPVNEIITGDCLEVMKGWPDNCVDLVVTSPPYDNLRDYQGYEFRFEDIAKELFRITVDGGVVVWVVGDSVIDGSESGTSFIQALHFKGIGFNLHDTMIYEKNGGLPDNCRYYQIFEYMFVFSKGRPKTINFLEDRKNRFTERWGKGRTVRNKNGSMSPRDDWHGREFGRRNNIWKYSTGAGYSTKELIAFEHPATFPEALASDHIKSWSNEGGTILDPMVGSGTTCKMAKMLGRNYIGIDISEEYCEIARQRLEAVDTGVPVKEQRAGQMALFRKGRHGCQIIRD